MSRSALDLAVRAVQLRSPGEGLTAITALRSQLDTLEALHVANALRSGWTWRQIADSLGITKQAAHRKHAKNVGAELEKESGAVPARGKLVVTAEARRCVQLARHEAKGLGHPVVAREHLLLGLLRDSYGPALRALTASGVSLPGVRAHVASLAFGPVDGSSADRPAIADATRATFEQSLQEAVRLRDGHLGVEHLLLALLRDEESSVAAILERVGTTAGEVKRRLDVILRQPTLVFRPGVETGSGSSSEQGGTMDGLERSIEVRAPVSQVNRRWADWVACGTAAAAESSETTDAVGMVHLEAVDEATTRVRIRLEQDAEGASAKLERFLERFKAAAERP